MNSRTTHSRTKPCDDAVPLCRIFIVELSEREEGGGGRVNIITIHEWWLIFEEPKDTVERKKGGTLGSVVRETLLVSGITNLAGGDRVRQIASDGSLARSTSIPANADTTMLDFGEPVRRGLPTNPSDSLLYPLRQPPTIGRFSPPLDAASKSTLSLRPLERPGLHSSCGIAAVETRKWRMSDLLDDDAFDDIFGDTSGTSSLGIQSGDKGSVLEDSAKKVDPDYLIETDFDDFFGSLDSPVGGHPRSGKPAAS